MELHDLTALEQGAAIRSGEVSPVELTEHYLRRSESLGPTVGAFITMTADLAMDQARAAEARVRSGDTGQLSPLFGVVAPVKDLNFVAGVRCTLGSAVFEIVPASDDACVANMRAAGLVFTGTTNTPEFGLPCYTENLVAPPARTPWDLTRSAGGSSGGAAAAVSAGLAPIAQGSDGGGSIRIPASVTGLVGIKPARGRVSTGPLRDPVGELPSVGPLARTVADAAALLDVLAVPVVGDPFPALPRADGSTFLDAAARDPGRMRIGRFATPIIADTEVDPEVLRAYEAATAALIDLGHEVEDIAAPFGPYVVPQFEAVWTVLALLTPVPPGREQDLLPLTRWLRERGAHVSGLELATAVSQMRLLARAGIVATAHLDAVLTPTLAKLPAPVGGLRSDADPAADFQAQKEFTPFTSPYNVSGQPALSLPLHWTADGLPVGVQLIGRPHDEWSIISLAAQLEAAHPWRERRPALW